MKEIIRHKADLSDLHVFHAVALCGGLNAAARALRVDPSTVSRALDQLEARLNARLVRRTAQGVVLTRAGELALARVRTIEHQIGELEREILDSDARSPAGGVTLSCSDGVGAYILTPALTHLLRENPKLDIQLDCGLWPDRPMDIESEISLVFNVEPVAGFISRPLAFFHYGLFGCKSFFELYGMPGSVEEALLHPFLHHVAQTYTGGQKRQVPAFQDLARRRVETNSSAAVVEGVVAGIGLAGLPTALVPLYPELVMVAGPATAIELSMVYHRDLERIPRIQAVIRWLESVFDQRTKPWFRPEFIHPNDFPANAAGLGGGVTLGVGEIADRIPSKMRVPKRALNQSGV